VAHYIKSTMFISLHYQRKFIVFYGQGHVGLLFSCLFLLLFCPQHISYMSRLFPMKTNGRKNFSVVS